MITMTNPYGVSWTSNMPLHARDTERMDIDEGKEEEEKQEQDYQDQQLDNFLRGLRGLYYSWGGSSLPASPSGLYQIQHEDDPLSTVDSVMIDASDPLQLLTESPQDYHPRGSRTTHAGYGTTTLSGRNQEKVPDSYGTRYPIDSIQTPQEPHDWLMEPVFCQGEASEPINEYGLTRMQMARLDQIVLLDPLNNDI